MDNEKYYSIVVGRTQPAKALQGSLNKQSMTPGPDAEEIMMEVGAIIIPNHSRVWARRVKDKMKDGEIVEVKDKDYVGKLEFLKWGDPKGTSIDIRFLPNSGTLDRMYQNEIQKLWWEDQWTTLKLLRGRNDIDTSQKPMFAEMLRRHTLNIDSPSRDPENTDYEYRNYNSESVINEGAKRITQRNLATDTVLNMQASPKKLAVAATLFEGMDPKSPDSVIFDELLGIAEKKWDTFNQVVKERKQSIQDLLNNALDKEVIFIDKESIITYYKNGKKELLIEVPEGEGTGMFIWLIENFLLPEVYDAMMNLEIAYNEYVRNLQ
jgi:hypothetical protein